MAEPKNDGTGMEYVNKTNNEGDGEGKSKYMRKDHTEVESMTQSVKKSTPKWDMKQTKKIQPNPVQRQQPKKSDPLREHTDKANKDGKGNTHGTNEGSEEKSKQSCEDTNVSPITKMGERVAVSKSVKHGNSNKKLDSEKKTEHNRKKMG